MRQTISASGAHEAVVQFAAQRSRSGADFYVAKELDVPCHASSSGDARVEGLAPGAQVEFEVVAVNAVGRSVPVAIRSVVPFAWPTVASASFCSPPEATTETSPCAEDTLQHEKIELQHELDRLADTLEEHDEDALNLQGDIIELLDKLQSVESLVTKASNCNQQALRREVSQLRKEVVRQSRLVKDTRQDEGISDVDDSPAHLQDEGDEVWRANSTASACSSTSSMDQETLESELRGLREDLQQRREKIQLQREDEAVEAKFQAPLAELQEVLRKLRAPIADDSFTKQAPADDVDSLRVLRSQFEKEREEFAKFQAVETERNQRKSTLLTEQEDELRKRAAQLSLAQAALTEERLALHSSRQRLAVVQAHALAMLERSQAQPVRDFPLNSPRGGSAIAANSVVSCRFTSTFTSDIPTEPDECIDKLWTMDWCHIPDAAEVRSFS